MKLAVIALSAAAVIASAPAVLAQDASSRTPGHATQKHGKKAGHHASGYATGHRMHANRSKTGYPGASRYAPSEPRDITDIAKQGGGGGGM